MTKEIKKKDPAAKIRPHGTKQCPHCKKFIASKGLANHTRDAHGF